MKNKEIVNWQDRKASERFAVIAPLLADDLDPAKRSQLRSQIAETNNISERTLYRLEAAWRRDGYSGLRPVNRQSRRSKKLPENFDEIIMQAVQLKKDGYYREPSSVPLFSVTSIMRDLASNR